MWWRSSSQTVVANEPYSAMRGGRSDLEAGTATGELVSMREKSREVSGELSGEGEAMGIPTGGDVAGET